MEEFVVPIQKENGHTLHIQIKPKYSTVKSRKVRTWTTQEDQQLMNLYEKFPKKWATIANHMYDRNENQCLHRYRRLSQLGAHKKIWSSEEDQTIKKMIKKVGKNWKVLSEILGTKTGKQIRERYINKLDPKINKEEWTLQEDKKLLQLYCVFGSKWSEISKQLPGRPQNKIKNRFYSYIKKNYDLKEKIVNPQLSEVFNPSNLMNSYKSVNKNSIYQSHVKLPSIQDFDLQNKQILEVKQTRPMDKENYIRSMIKLQEDWGLKRQSIGDIVSQNEIILDRDLLYLSHY